MDLEILQIPALKDNYIYLLHSKKTHQTAVIDPAESSPVNKVLKQKNWNLDFIFNTHHHYDHVGGNLELKEKWNCKVYGYEGDAKRIPGIDVKLKEKEQIAFGAITLDVLYIPGHTSGHIAYHCKEENYLFCGDCLFAMGCGYLFEGTPQEMFSSLSQIKKLPPETMIHCGHEYSLKNGSFALSLNKDNQHLHKRMAEIKDLRAQNKPTVPFQLKIDLLTNPFLLAKTVTEFAKIRLLKDDF